jgi:hypothetical protein
LSLHWESLDKHRSKSEENLKRAFDHFERELGVPRTSAALSCARKNVHATCACLVICVPNL